jgi:small GTP-binding protein
LLKRGIRISLLGPPNAGKSSLLNVIVDREASIVSEEAGTTRDVVEVSVDIGGYLCVFADTAGLRSTSVGAIEQEGIRRAKAKAKDSDLVRLSPFRNALALWHIQNLLSLDVQPVGTFKAAPFKMFHKLWYTEGCS